MDDARLVAVPDFLIEGHSYIFTKTFDAYLCGIGRVTVHKDVICKFTETKRESPQDLVSVGMKASDTFWVSNKCSVFLVKQ